MNIAFFITHKTLTEDHAEVCLTSLARQKTDKKIDVLYIYNTHQDEILNSSLSTDMMLKYKLDKIVKKIEIFDYDERTPKTLGSDIIEIRKFLKENYSPTDRVLLLKSDCVLSANYLEEALSIDPSRENIYFVSPFNCAKDNATNEEIYEYIKRDKWIPSDEITFLVEDFRGKYPLDLHRSDLSVNDPKIRFTSCYVVNDFSCHFLNIGLLDQIRIREQSWGGIWFSNITNYLITTENAFVVHKFHGIISENRDKDREGPVASWLKG